MAHLVLLFIFHVNVITCQNFNLPHIYCIFVEKTLFFEMIFFQISQMVSKHCLNYVK
jgi:hypothetical protein